MRNNSERVEEREDKNEEESTFDVYHKKFDRKVRAWQKNGVKKLNH